MSGAIGKAQRTLSQHHSPIGVKMKPVLPPLEEADTPPRTPFNERHSQPVQEAAVTMTTTTMLNSSRSPSKHLNLVATGWESGDMHRESCSQNGQKAEVRNGAINGHGERAVRTAGGTQHKDPKLRGFY